MIKNRKLSFTLIAACLCLVTNIAAQTPSIALDSETISGLGARNIGSAAMSGRIAAVDAVQEGQRLPVFVGAESGGVSESVKGGTTFTPVLYQHTIESLE